jgi:HAD superfamily hydrolase (TIGR01490 family)
MATTSATKTASLAEDNTVVHIFDVDNTVIRKTSAWYFLREALSTGLIRFSQISRLPYELIKYKLGKPDMDFIEKSVKCLANIEQDALVQCAHNTFIRYIKPNIYTNISKRIRETDGKVIFATSSLDIIIRPLEEYFGIGGSLATRLEFKEGKTTGKLTGGSLFGSKKKDAVLDWLTQNNISNRNVCFYSDSYTDLPLLEICGKPVAVNPDRTLLGEAKKQGWEILRVREIG